MQKMPAASTQLRMVARLDHPWTSGARTTEHRHAFHELAVVLEGECHWRIAARGRLELRAGDFLLLPPQRRHREEIPAGKHARMLWVGFTAEDADPRLAPVLERAWSAGPWAEDLFALGDMLYREHQRPELPASAGRVEGLLGALLSTLFRVAAGADEPPAGDSRHGAALRAAAHTLRRNLAQPPRVSELARHHGLTAGHFSTLFQAAHGLAPRAFLQRARLEEASRLLRETDATVKEIADACGYAGAPHFCRAFKTAAGLPPRAWRLSAAQGLPS